MIYEIITNSITSKDDIGDVSLKSKIPEGALYFEGIVSNGDKNRNGYIIDEEAWFFDKNKYTKNFLKSGSVLYNHNSNMPIGRPLSFEKTDKGILVSGYAYDDNYTNGAIGRGLVLGLSTGHITHESLYRNNKTSEEMSVKDFYKKLWGDDNKVWEEYQNGYWDWVVSKAEIIEFSFVTTPSNRKSILNNAKDDLLLDIMSKVHNEDINDMKKILLSKYGSMTDEEKIKAEKEAETNAKNEAETNSIETLTNELSLEKNKVVELEKNLLDKNTEIETLKNSLIEKDTDLSKKETEINSLRDEAKKVVLASFPKGDKEENKAEVKNIDDFKNKYLSK